MEDVKMHRARNRAALLGCASKVSGLQDRERTSHSLSFRHSADADVDLTARQEDGVLSFFTAEERKKSVDEWKLPEASGTGEDEGEQLVGREIMVDTLGVGMVTDFHDMTAFNEHESRHNSKHKKWSSPHTVRFYESGLDEHGMERTVKLFTASEIEQLDKITRDQGHNKLQLHNRDFKPSHRAYMVRRKAIETEDTDSAGDVDLNARHNKGCMGADEDIDTIFKIVDKDSSGTISFPEFAGWLTRRQMATQGFVTPGNLKEWQVSWSKFDTDNSHTLCREEFQKVMEDFADKDWGEAVDPKTNRHYYYHRHTRETKWVKPSHDLEINDFLVHHGVRQQNDDRHQKGPSLTLNVQKMMTKLRVQPNRLNGRRHFFLFLFYLSLLMGWWHIIADIDNGRGVESGLHSRINAIQFEVTPGPHHSQSIRATNWAGVRTLGDLHDLTLATVENLYSDDDSTYFTPEDREELKSNTLQRVYRNSEFTHLWKAVGIDTDKDNLRQNCSNWVIVDPSDGGFAGECEFFDKCTGDVLEETRRIVTLIGNATRFDIRKRECQTQHCEHRYETMSATCGVSHRNDGKVDLAGCSNPGCKMKLRLASLWDSECQQWMTANHPNITDALISECLARTSATNEECSVIQNSVGSGLELKLACEAREGCKYWTELWRESCVSTSVYNSWKQHGARSSQRYNSDQNAGLTNLHNHPLPWLILKMNRRKLSSCDATAECQSNDCSASGQCAFTNDIDYDEFIGDETGSVYKYDKTIGGFPFYIRLDDSSPQTWIGLLELLRADRWLSHNTKDFTMECLTLNPNTHTLGFWSITYEIDLSGMIRKPKGLLVRSFPLDVADPDHRHISQQILALGVFLCQVIDFLFLLRETIYIVVVELCQRDTQLQIQKRTRVVQSSNLKLLAAVVSSFLCLWVIVLTYTFLFGKQAVDFARIEPELLGYRFTGIASRSTADTNTCHDTAGVFDPECEIGEKIDLVETLKAGLESWVQYRNLWSVFCLWTVLRLLGKLKWATGYSVLITTLTRASHQLGYILLLIGMSGWVFSYMFHLCYGRRFFEFRSIGSTMFALLGPILGGDSSLEAAAIASSRAGDHWLSVGMYSVYAVYVVFLVINILLAIIVDGYEDAKDMETAQQEDEEWLKQEVSVINELFDVMETHEVSVPTYNKNVLYIKVPDVKVYSCGNEPVEQEAANSLKDYEFQVSVVQPWHGMPKVDPTNTHTSKATFTYLIKIERLQAPQTAPDGWPHDFTLQALIRRRKRSGKRGEVWSEFVNSCWLYLAWLTKLWRSFKTGNIEVTSEEKWARDGLNFLEITLTDYINDKIDVQARNLILDGTLDNDEAIELEERAKTRDLAATRSFITERMKDLRTKAEAARSATVYRTDRSDPTLQKRLRQLEEEMRRLKVIETLGATELSHRDLVEALSRARDRMHQDSVMRHRPSVRCPKPLIKKIWKTFAAAEDEDISDMVGPPATWKQIDRLDDKVTAMLNCEPALDTETTALPALVSKLNGIQDTLSKVVPQIENLVEQVDVLTSKVAGISTPLTGCESDVPPPPPPAEGSETSVRDRCDTAMSFPNYECLGRLKF